MLAFTNLWLWHFRFSRHKILMSVSLESIGVPLAVASLALQLTAVSLDVMYILLFAVCFTFVNYCPYVHIVAIAYVHTLF